MPRSSFCQAVRLSFLRKSLVGRHRRPSPAAPLQRPSERARTPKQPVGDVEHEQHEHDSDVEARVAVQQQVDEPADGRLADQRRVKGFLQHESQVEWLEEHGGVDAEFDGLVEGVRAQHVPRAEPAVLVAEGRRRHQEVNGVLRACRALEAGE